MSADLWVAFNGGVVVGGLFVLALFHFGLPMILKRRGLHITKTSEAAHNHPNKKEAP